MEDALPSHAAKDFFRLLSNLASLRHHPEAIKKLTPQDEEWLDGALKDYETNALNLAMKFIEPLRKDDPAKADDIYDFVRRLVYTSTVIGATLIFSDSTRAFLEPDIVRDVAVSRAANARKGKDKKPDQIALKNAVYKFQNHESAESFYIQASKMHFDVNKELNRNGFDSVDKRKIERMLRKIHIAGLKEM